MRRRHLIVTTGAAAVLALAAVAGADGAAAVASGSEIAHRVLGRFQRSGRDLLGAGSLHASALTLDEAAVVARGFSCTGSSATTSIPSTVATAAVLGAGGDGGSGSFGISSADNDGGQGSAIVTAMPVNPGETLTAYAGCAGAPSPSGAST